MVFLSSVSLSSSTLSKFNPFSLNDESMLILSNSASDIKFDLFFVIAFVALFFDLSKGVGSVGLSRRRRFCWNLNGDDVCCFSLLVDVLFQFRPFHHREGTPWSSEEHSSNIDIAMDQQEMDQKTSKEIKHHKNYGLSFHFARDQTAQSSTSVPGSIGEDESKGRPIGVKAAKARGKSRVTSLEEAEGNKENEREGDDEVMLNALLIWLALIQVEPRPNRAK
ncbi:hypothetical protein F2Q69_00058142 [Brassica cretica]|uniref:Uncharacterized protein n=1 Tax=Brassica cretica TaxID=69181 RepID=A0A8S9RSE3_BRACR|nr:hypothetical protein F2Q69_00058142 [Brassica cretica]